MYTGFPRRLFSVGRKSVWGSLWIPLLTWALPLWTHYEHLFFGSLNLLLINTAFITRIWCSKLDRQTCLKWQNPIFILKSIKQDQNCLSEQLPSWSNWTEVTIKKTKSLVYFMWRVSFVLSIIKAFSFASKICVNFGCTDIAHMEMSKSSLLNHSSRVHDYMLANLSTFSIMPFR